MRRSLSGAIDVAQATMRWRNGDGEHCHEPRDRHPGPDDGRRQPYIYTYIVVYLCATRQRRRARRRQTATQRRYARYPRIAGLNSSAVEGGGRNGHAMLDSLKLASWPPPPTTWAGRDANCQRALFAQDGSKGASESPRRAPYCSEDAPGGPKTAPRRLQVVSFLKKAPEMPKPFKHQKKTNDVCLLVF